MQLEYFPLKPPFIADVQLHSFDILWGTCLTPRSSTELSKITGDDWMLIPTWPGQWCSDLGARKSCSIWRKIWGSTIGCYMPIHCRKKQPRQFKCQLRKRDNNQILNRFTPTSGVKIHFHWMPMSNSYSCSNHYFGVKLTLLWLQSTNSFATSATVPIWGMLTIQLEWPSAPNREFDRTPSIALKRWGLPQEENSKCWQPQVTNSWKAVAFTDCILPVLCTVQMVHNIQRNASLCCECSCFLCSTTKEPAWIAWISGSHLSSHYGHQWCPNSSPIPPGDFWFGGGYPSNARPHWILAVPSDGLGILIGSLESLAIWVRWWSNPGSDKGIRSDQILLKTTRDMPGNGIKL